MLDLLGFADAHPESPAALEAESGTVWSYGRLRSAVEEVRERLPAEKGMLLLLVRRDLPSLVAYLSALASGHAVLPVEADLDETLLGALVELYRPDLVLGADLSLRTRAPGSFPGYRVRGDVGHGLTLLVRERSGNPPPHPDLSLLLSTSGSTGSPKLVRLSAGNVLANACAIREALAIGSELRPITSLPWSYSFGLSVVNSHLLAGGCLITTDRSLVSREFWDQARAYDATSFYGVPYMYEMLRRVGFARMDLPSLKVLAQAGGKLGVDLIREFSQLIEGRGGRFFVMYGQTEATARISVLPPASLGRKLGSVGLPLPGGRIEIVRPGQGDECGPGDEGEVVYHGPNVMLGYSNVREDLARGDELGGHLVTGDLGYLDEEGFLYITGRLKRFAKAFGLRINLDEVEGHLHGAGMVGAFQLGERIRVCCRHDAVQEVQAALDTLAGRMRVHRAAFEVLGVDDIPLLSNGKIDYAALRESAGG